jgi:tetratricopeptide (TPR) repeat protein
MVLSIRHDFVWWALLRCGLVLALVSADGAHAARTSPALVVKDPHQQTRQTLEDGASTSRDLQMLSQNASLPDGLRGEILERMNAPKEALALYRKAMKDSGPSQSAARLRAARLAEAAGDKELAIAAWQGVLQDPVWASEILVMAEAMGALQRHSILSQSASLLVDEQGQTPFT